MRKTSDYERHVDDAYYEPAWCDERLFELMASHLHKGSVVLDPACGTGTIPLAARRAGLKGIGMDIVARWPVGTKGFAVRDFLGPWKDPPFRIDAIVSNPPYRLAEEFAKLALQRARLVAFLLPTRWIQGSKRARWLETTPLALMCPLCPRPSMPPIGSDSKPSSGKVDYSWFVWNTWKIPGWNPQVEWLHK